MAIRCENKIVNIYLYFIMSNIFFAYKQNEICMTHNFASFSQSYEHLKLPDS
jgi:hypothetical protein